MNLRLTEYVIAFYSPCDHRSYIIDHDQSEVSHIYKARCVGVVDTMAVWDFTDIYALSPCLRLLGFGCIQALFSLYFSYMGCFYQLTVCSHEHGKTNKYIHTHFSENNFKKLGLV